tara:strand:+ start:543 stop:1127 length:585 start_codon:yes stop_codon:yes gene_type:complete
MRRFLIYVLLPIIILILGISIGIIIRDFPKFSLNYNLKITEIISLLLTLGIGVFIPLIVKKLIEDKRSFKNSLIEEVSSFNKITNTINQRLVTIHSSGKLTRQDKDGFILLFEIADEEFNQLCEFLKEHSNSEIQTYISQLETKYMEYWKTLTGSEVTKSSLRKLNDDTFKKAAHQHVDMKSIARKIKIGINKM